MKKLALSLLVCLGVIAAGVGTVWAITSKSTEPGQEAAKEESARRVPNVEIQVIEAQTLEDRLTLTGSVEPWESVILSSESRGNIEWKGVEEGDAVTTGQELFRIDTEAIRAQLVQAEAQNKLANQQLDRLQRLAKTKVATAQDLDSAIANRDVAAASVRLAKIQRDKSVVQAPFDGVVDRAMREQQEFVDVGTPLVQVVQTHKVKIQVGVPERDIPHFAVGDKVEIRVDSIPDTAFPGVIHRIATTADMMTHTFSTEIEVDNAKGTLKPGMVARASLLRKAYPNSVVIPIFTAILLDDRRIAFVEEDGLAQMRPIDVGILKGGSVQVVKGLEPGERLIVKGQYEVRPGERVNIQQVNE